MLGSIGKQKFTKALVLSGGASVIEVDVGHAPRAGAVALLAAAAHAHGAARARRLLAAADPVDRRRRSAIVCSLLAVALGIYGVVYWIDNANFPGPLFGGVAVLFVLGIQGFILALIGEYLGRIQRDVEGRPLYLVDSEL